MSSYSHCCFSPGLSHTPAAQLSSQQVRDKSYHTTVPSHHMRLSPRLWASQSWIPPTSSPSTSHHSQALPLAVPSTPPILRFSFLTPYIGLPLPLAFLPRFVLPYFPKEGPALSTVLCVDLPVCLFISSMMINSGNMSQSYLSTPNFELHLEHKETLNGSCLI